MLQTQLYNDNIGTKTKRSIQTRSLEGKKSGTAFPAFSPHYMYIVYATDSSYRRTENDTAFFLLFRITSIVLVSFSWSLIWD